MRALAPLLCSVLLLGSGCETESSSPPVDLPATSSVVARVDGFEITRADLDVGSRYAAHITLNEATERHLQRVALRDLLLPRAAIASLDPESRTAALARAVAFRAKLLDGMPAPQDSETGELEVISSGDVQTFGPFVLGAALELEPGAWSDPIEGLGHYHLVRLIELPVEGSAPSITLGVIDFPYVELTQTPGEILDQTTLEIVDPAMHEIIPAALRYRMRQDPPLPETTD